MPSYFPELDAALPFDSEWRSLQKWCSILYSSVGNVAGTGFPEGTAPQPGDDEERLLTKINAMLE